MEIGLILFFLYLLFMIILDLALIVSLLRQGDERRQLMVWKASTWTLMGTAGSLIISIIESLVKTEAMSVNPFIILTATATIYFIALLYYQRRYN